MCEYIPWFICTKDVHFDIFIFADALFCVPMIDNRNFSFGLQQIKCRLLYRMVVCAFHPSRLSRMISVRTYEKWQIDGLVPERRNSTAIAQELRLSCTNPSKYPLINIHTFWFLYTLFLKSCKIYKLSFVLLCFVSELSYPNFMSYVMMTSSNENIFCVTGPLSGKFTSDAGFDVFLDLRLNKLLSN